MFDYSFKTMNIKQALKEKNKFVKNSTELFARLDSNNSIEEGAVRHYDVEETLTNLLNNLDDLVEIKTKIHLANAEVYNKIFMLSEYKNFVKTLRMLDCNEGVVRNKTRYSYDDNALKKTTIIDVKRRDSLIELYESKIEQIQEELDVHNVTKSI